jgi:hypothetical protein
MARTTPAAGDNSSKVSPDDFLACMSNIRAAKRKMDEATAVYRAERKRAKDKGIDMSALAFVESLAKLEDAEAQSRMANIARFAAWMELPVGTQAGLFADEQKPAQKMSAALAEENAYEAGYQAGRKGRDRGDHQYHPGSPLHDCFDRGWIAGQKFIADHMGGIVPKRGRKKQGNPFAPEANA